MAKRKIRKTHFTVELAIPPGVTEAEMRAYILNEVCSGIGQYHTDDPIRQLDRASVKVKRHKRRLQFTRAEHDWILHALSHYPGGQQDWMRSIFNKIFHPYKD